jgi:hypothetical protein
MVRTLESRHIGLGAAQDAPPRWAVTTVKCCVVGILALPATTLLWLTAASFWPEEAQRVAPLAFAASILLGLLMASCASILTDIYPPVPRNPTP